MKHLLLGLTIAVSVAWNGAAAFSAVPSNSKQPSASQNMAKWPPILEQSPTFNVTQAGGWNTVESLAGNPKDELVEYIMAYNNGGTVNPTKVFALVGLLQAQGKGYAANLVNGEWISVLSQEGTKSPKIQKLVSSKEQSRTKPSYANFDVDHQKFYGEVSILKYGSLQSTVAYNPVKDGYDFIGDKIVLRRISCDIVGASWKWWKLPKIPLPLRAKGGYLDFVYLDKDMRITRGNRGGIFVHFRPEFWEQQREKDETSLTEQNVNGAGI